jgi:hypothetical protein
MVPDRKLQFLCSERAVRGFSGVRREFFGLAAPGNLLRHGTAFLGRAGFWMVRLL